MTWSSGSVHDAPSELSATITAARQPPARSRLHPVDPPKVRFYEWSVAVPTMVALVYFVVVNWSNVSKDALELIEETFAQ